MLWRRAFGEMPEKHHTALRDAAGKLRYEMCLTREGFEGAYSISYHLNRPQAAQHSHATPASSSMPRSTASPGARPGEPSALSAEDETPTPARRHFWTRRVEASRAPASRADVPLLVNDDLAIGVSRPARSDERYFIDVDADRLYFVHEGGGVVESPYGSLKFKTGDYVCIPKGVLHRIDLTASAQHWLTLSCRRDLGLLRQWRNEAGQLRMDAPYCERDFRVPEFKGPVDEGIRELIVRRRDQDSLWHYQHSPLDAVGYDGCVYPWAFPILNFQPRVSSVHLPPTWHGTFACDGALICSFVPRPVDFHEEAIPCPYPHASVDIDEVLFYSRGNFASRRGVGPGSISFHPAGLPHGPHPGMYESSVGTRRTDELAVMIDSRRSLSVTESARRVEDPDYETSFLE